MATFASASCGRQITPSPGLPGNPATDNLAGKMLIRFRTIGPMNFGSYAYVIVFNTNPSPNNATNEPYPQALLSGTFKNFSFAFAVGGAYSGGIAAPVLFQYYIIPPGTNLQQVRLQIQPSLVSLQPNDNGQNTEFTFIFDRLQLNIAPPYTPTPVPSPSISPSPTPTPSASPLVTPSPLPSLFYSNIWYINFFSVDTNGNPVDALGTGVTDTTFSFSIDITQQTQNTISRPSGFPQVNPAANIQGGEIDNYP